MSIGDTLAIKAKVAGWAIKITETAGWARDALAVQALLIGATVHIRAALSLERNTNAALTDFAFGALRVVLAERVFTASTNTVSTEATITVDSAFCGHAGELITNRSWSTIDIDNAFTHKLTQII